MHRRNLIALGGAILVLVLMAPAAVLAAGAPSVTVRVEGLKHTLLKPTAVRAATGWITKGGTPRGKCPAASAAGAMDAATHHRWAGKYSASVGGLEILSILGERHKFSSPDYWEIFVGNRPASVGACQLKLHRGEQLLFAAVSQKKVEYPIAIRAPRHATVGHPFTATVVSFNAKGVARPLAAATVSVVRSSSKAGKPTESAAASTRRGTAVFTERRAGTYTVTAQKAGFVRAAPVRVRVTG